MPPFNTQSGGRRVAVLGASSVHGGAAADQTVLTSADWQHEFPALIEQNTGIPTLNLGTAGAQSADLLAVLQQLVEYSLDVVVLYTGHCDVGNAYFERQYRGFGGLAVQFHPWLERSQLFVQYRGLLEAGREALTAPEDELDALPFTDGEVRRIQRSFRDNLEQIGAICDSRGLELVFVTPVSDLTYPPVYGVGPEGETTYDLWNRGMQLRPTDPAGAARLLEQARDRSMRPVRASTAVEAIVREVAEQRGAILVDARRDVPMDSHGAVPAPWLFIDELHFSDRGHAAMAELIGPAVVACLQDGTENPSTE